MHISGGLIITIYYILLLHFRDIVLSYYLHLTINANIFDKTYLNTLKKYKTLNECIPEMN